MSLLLVAWLLTQFVATTLGAWKLSQWASRVRLVDMPNHRSSHALPTPRGGGLAIVVVFFSGIGCLYSADGLAPDIAAALSAGVLIASIGFCDDVTSIRARTRFLVHLIAAAWAIGILLWSMPGSPHGWLIQCLMFAGWVIALVWGTNLFNFMDGIDGLAAAEAIFLACAAALIFHQFNLPAGYEISTLMIAATTGGFLLLNWSPASIFMGDVGSGFLGFILALIGMFASARYSIPIEVWVILAGIFFLDATITLIIRALRRQNPAKAHRTHAYQHISLDYGHSAAVLCVCGVNIFWLLPWALAAAHYRQASLACLLIALTPVAIAVLRFGAGRDRPIGQ